MSQTLSSTDCFDGIVGLRGCCEANEAQVWINDLGIDQAFIASVQTNDYSSPADFFQKKLRFAIQTTVNQIHAFMRPKYKSYTVVDNLRTGFYKDDLVQVAGDGKLKGIQFDVCKTGTYLDFFINEISLQINSTQTVSVLVYDLLQNKLLDTFDIDCVADEITSIYVNKKYSSGKKRLNLFIGYDSTGISANTSTLTDGCRDCSGVGYSRYNNSYEKITAGGIEIADDKINGNLVPNLDTGGLSVVHSLMCNHEAWLCSVSSAVAFPILYKLASLIYEHALGPGKDQRTNTTTNINWESIKERLDKTDFHFSQSMNEFIQNIKPPKDDTCFFCRDNIRHIVSMP